MPHVGQEIKRANGFVVKIVRLEDEVLEIEARYRGDAPLAQAHYHPSQDEHFEVLSGRIHAVIGGDEVWYDQGEQFDIHAGVSHQMAAEGPTVLKWEVRPALRTAEFFERFYDALDNGFPEGMTAQDFLGQYSDVFRLSATD
ncbi:MAG TPA: cupin domain-containing protein [Thermoleophilaceae bacterium]|jgi:mannose-6-phosphate isomerase-like protein (cupin superfamily)|nr:cupin domain-containing protein [Thermoleophilaceae bacterium]